MQTHDEERDIYGAVYVQGKKYYLLEPRPVRNKEWWMDGVNKWLVADEESFSLTRNPDVEIGQKGDYVWLGESSYIVIGSDVLIEFFPVPLSKKVIRFYVTDDEEA